MASPLLLEAHSSLVIWNRAFVLPKFYYGINVWGGSNVKDLEKINLFQRRAKRLGVTDTYL